MDNFKKVRPAWKKRNKYAKLYGLQIVEKKEKNRLSPRYVENTVGKVENK